MSPTTIPGNLILQSPTANDPLLDLNTQPSLDLQFATSKTLDDRVSGFPLVNHQRDASSGKSAGTYVGSDGLIKTSPVNYSLNSEQVNLWTPNNGSVSSNFAESPIGDQTADKWIPDTTNAYHYPSNNITGLASTGSVTYSVYAKQAGYRYLVVNTPAGSTEGNSGPMVDLQDGVVVDNFGATYSTNITDAGNDWWRIAITFTKSGPVLQVDHNPLPTSTIAAYTGDGTSGVLLWGAQLEEGSTATTYIPTGATIGGAPRFDHDPVTGESLGLLIEESRTNLLQYSEQFDQSAWSKAQATVTPNIVTAPDGTQTADKLVMPISASTFHLCKQTATVSAGTITASIYAKKADFDWFLFKQDSGSAAGSAYRGAWFNLNTGSVGTVDSGLTANIEGAENGWYRCSIKYILTGSGTSAIAAIISPGDGQQNIVGDGTSGVYLWGAQLEEGSFPTSYIPTTSSTVTRAADLASIEGTNFSSWYNQSEGTVYITYQNRNVSTPFSAAKFNDGTGLNIITPVNNSNNAEIVTAGVIVFSETTSANVYLQTLKRALAFEENNTRLAANGTLVGAVDTSVTIPVVNKVDIGTGTAGAIARLAYYPYRLADATLQEITS